MATSESYSCIFSYTATYDFHFHFQLVAKISPNFESYEIAEKKAEEEKAEQEKQKKKMFRRKVRKRNLFITYQTELFIFDNFLHVKY